ncbi:hypothetical protein GCM10010260_04040 [Streptomyces filipinensis]|uniref:Secreted protein n=1 Tax=Streptomyces filipinensis TaxID=66887 RepID=A0A918I741_9ACTN|nr:hypothetical protein GCM10010260_04040 [Streptomyces filipinensis]
MRAARIGQALAAAGITAAAVLTPVATATPAAAYDPSSPCSNYVGNHGYRVGPKVEAACHNLALHPGVGWFPNPYCVHGLIVIGVEAGVAQNACVRAHL